MKALLFGTIVQKKILLTRWVELAYNLIIEFLGRMGWSYMELTREEAWKLLTEYNQDAFHLKHAQIVEGVMRYFARELGYGEQEEFWGIVGLLHDLDFERYPEQHCIKEQEIMRERGIDASVKECVRSGAEIRKEKV